MFNRINQVCRKNKTTIYAFINVWFVFCLWMAAFLNFVATQTALASSGEVVTVRYNELNVRDAPNGNPITSVTRDQKFKVIEHDGDWVKVDLDDNKTGWIYGQPPYVQIEASQVASAFGFGWLVIIIIAIVAAAIVFSSKGKVTEKKTASKQWACPFCGAIHPKNEILFQSQLHDTLFVVNSSKPLRCPECNARLDGQKLFDKGYDLAADGWKWGFVDSTGSISLMYPDQWAGTLRVAGADPNASFAACAPDGLTIIELFVFESGRSIEDYIQIVKAMYPEGLISDTLFNLGCGTARRIVGRRKESDGKTSTTDYFCVTSTKGVVSLNLKTTHDYESQRRIFERIAKSLRLP